MHPDRRMASFVDDKVPCLYCLSTPSPTCSLNDLHCDCYIHSTVAVLPNDLHCDCYIHSTVAALPNDLHCDNYIHSTVAVLPNDLHCDSYIPSTVAPTL